MNDTLLKCPTCGYTYNSSKRWGWYRVYIKEIDNHRHLILKCRKCEAKFMVKFSGLEVYHKADTSNQNAYIYYKKGIKCIGRHK